MAERRKKILVVEDELIIALDINKHLQKMGYSVFPVLSSGEEAVKKASLLKPSLILMDIVLKGKINGITAANKIISEHNIPVIFLTAYADPTTIKKAIKTNAYGYLVKPFNTRELQAAIEMALHRSKTDKKLKKNEEKLLSAFNNMQDIFYRTDRTGRITWVSPSAAKTLGFNSTDEIIGKDLAEDFYADPAQGDFFLKELHKKGKLTDYRVTLKKKDGSTLIVSTNSHIHKNRDGEFDGVEGVCRDITERKRARDQIKKHRERLEDLIKERTSELLKTNKTLQNEINERKKIEAELISSQNRLEYVKQIGALANSTLKLDNVLELILKGTIEASNASAGMIFLKNPETRTVSLEASFGLSKAFVKEYREHHIRPGEGLTGRIAASGDAIYIREDSSHDPRIARSVFVKEKLHSFIGVPIYADNEIVGVMNILTRPPDIFSEQEITLVTAVGAYVGSAIRNAQHFEERMRIEMKLLEYQKHLQSLTSQISLIEENEKRRIAAGLHDCISQPLALSKIKLGQLNKTTLPDESKAIISELSGLIEQTINETRTLTFELSPPILYELGLSQAIKWLIDEFRDKHNLHTVFEDDEHSKPFDNNIRFFLFQAVRELLVNIVKHSGADKAKITMSGTKDKLRITVEDNGRGFSSKRSGRNGFGLFNIREQMNHINGHFEIKAVPRRGTRVTLIAPFTAN